jgi:hypothetical protein
MIFINYIYNEDANRTIKPWIKYQDINETIIGLNFIANNGLFVETTKKSIQITSEMPICDNQEIITWGIEPNIHSDLSNCA